MAALLYSSTLSAPTIIRVVSMSLEARVEQLENKQDQQFDYISNQLADMQNLLKHVVQEQTDIKDYVKMIHYACVSQPK